MTEKSKVETAIENMPTDQLEKLTAAANAEANKRKTPPFGSMTERQLNDWKHENCK